MERAFVQGSYGHLMASMIITVAKTKFDHTVIKNWHEDLEQLSKSGDYYFAIDLVVAIISKPKKCKK
jgi:hypothetical protein